MKEQIKKTQIKHCFCSCEGEVLQIPVSYDLTHEVAKIQTLIETQDEDEDIRMKFQRYNPNLSKYLSKNSKPIYIERKVKQNKKVEKKQVIVEDSNKLTVKKGQQITGTSKQFEYKKFEYIDKRSDCSCEKRKFTKFVWKPFFNSGYYSGTIPQYRVDQDNNYIKTRQTRQKDTQKDRQKDTKIVEPSLQRMDAMTQTNKQAKPQVSFGDLSEVKPPRVRPPIGDIIPQEFEQKIQQNKMPVQHSPIVQPNMPPFDFLRPQVQHPFKPLPKARQNGSSIFKQFQQHKQGNLQEESDSRCNCLCHTKVCKCTSFMKKQLLDGAIKNSYFAERLISNGRSEVCRCIVSSCKCNCHLKHYQLPQYRLNPQNYRTLPANQMVQIPYAGKMRRYDFNKY